MSSTTHRLFRLVLALGITVAAATVPATALGGVLLGIHGNTERFRDLTGQRSAVEHVMMGWGQVTGARLDRMLGELGDVPLVALKTGPLGGETITPREIAQGEGDAFLVDLNRAVSAFGGTVYVRPLPEMNGHWNPYCAFDRSGRSRGPEHSTAAFRHAFARIAVIVRGGPAHAVDAELRRLGLPPLGRDLPEAPNARILWNPQGFGSPDLPGNSAQAYYPGDRYVDVVGNDLYAIRGKAEWEAADALYRAHPDKPYAFPEWGVWGIDDAAFVRRMAQFVRSHPRVELLAWYTSRPGSIFDLGTKPATRAAYRDTIVPLGG